MENVEKLQIKIKISKSKKFEFSLEIQKIHYAICLIKKKSEKTPSFRPYK